MMVNWKARAEKLEKDLAYEKHRREVAETKLAAALQVRDDLVAQLEKTESALHKYMKIAGVIDDDQK